MSTSTAIESTWACQVYFVGFLMTHYIPSTNNMIQYSKCFPATKLRKAAAVGTCGYFWRKQPMGKRRAPLATACWPLIKWRELSYTRNRTSLQYGFYTTDRSPLAPTVREQIHALKTPETVPAAAFEAYRSFVPPQPAAVVTESPEELTGTLSERIKASVTVLEIESW